MKNVIWGYSETLDRRIDGSCRNVRWFGKCNISTFTKAIIQVGNSDNCGVKWIRDRISPTGNAQELLLLEISNFTYILCKDDRTGEIIHAVPLATKVQEGTK